MDEVVRDAQAVKAKARSAELAARGVRLVSVTWVDNSGITRVKAVPVERLETAAAWGIGVSPVFDSFLFNDLPVSGKHAPGAVGDLRLHPDLERLVVLAGQPGWAWAPGNRYDQEGNVHPLDQRSVAQAATARLAAEGYAAKMAFEVEWALGLPDDASFSSAAHGPAYGHARLVQRSDYLRDLAEALAAQGLPVEQVHPEYASGQFELSVATGDPVFAADSSVLVRETIRAISARHGMRATFAPKVLADGVGNGGHVHLSLWRDGVNSFSAGSGPYGMDPRAEAFAAGILSRLPALLAVGAPSVASYLRLVPQHWAGAYTAWGLENREAALRVVTGAAGSRSWAANAEVKCFDQAANPYLVVAGLLFAGLAGLAEDKRLPEPVDVDPALLSSEEQQRRGIRRLPMSLADSVAAFENDSALTEGFGIPLAATIADVRRGEIAHFGEADPEAIVSALRWVY